MIKKFEINEYKQLKLTNINIDCGLLQKFNRDDFVKELIDLISKYEDYCANNIDGE